jgi:hypothetical protein
MTVLRVTIEDEQTEYIKKILSEAHVINIEEEATISPDVAAQPKPESALERIKKIQERIGNQELFKEITDPSEWQREIRKEWDRDF